MELNEKEKIIKENKKRNKKKEVQYKLTLVVDASPAVCSWVFAQALVLFTCYMFGPLQDRNILQKLSTKLSFFNLAPDAL